MHDQIKEIMNQHSRTGSKLARREEISKLLRFADWLIANQHGVKRLEQIGRRHIHDFYTSLNEQQTASSTIYKYALAIDKLWREMGRSGIPPRP